VSAARLSTFLLVEDDELVCELLSRMLQTSERRILTAPDEQRALEHVCATHVDLLLTDLRGPSALDVADRLRVLQPHLRVLYMCAWFDDALADLVQDADVVLKPFTLAELEAAVARALDRPSTPPSPAAAGGGPLRRPTP
jgi:DNA-binding response OmpR family regulator